MQRKKIGIADFPFSNKAVNYLNKQWLRIMSLYVLTTVSVIEKAKDMKIGGLNQHAEGMISNEKNHVFEMKAKANEPATYWWYQYLNLHQGSKYMVIQMEQYDGYIELRRTFISKKTDKDIDSNDITVDATELEEEDNTYMIWDCGST